MTAIVNGHQADPYTALRRADQRWCQERADDPGDPDYLRHLADAVKPVVGAPIVDSELSVSVGRLEQLRAELADAQRQIGKLRADYHALAAERQRDQDAVAAALDERTQLTKLVEQLRQQLADATRHRCTWEWPDPNRPALPCSCGRPDPRYPALVETEEEAAAAIRRSGGPWGELWARLRGELAGWGES